jgi:O-antigen ligase
MLALVAIYEWFAERTFVSNEKLDVSNAYSGMFRVNSLLYDPSLYGRVEVLAILTVVCVVLLGPPGWRTLATALVAPVLFAGLVVTFSHTSFAALAGGLVTIAAIAWRRTVAVLLLAGVVALTVGVALSQPQIMKVLNTSVDKASSSRVGLATRGVRTFREHPVRGVGLGGFGVATGDTAEEKARVAPHNVVVDVASELGILGLAIFGSTLVAVIIAIRRLDRPLLRLILAAALVALVVHGLAYDQFFSDPTWWTIAVLAAVGAAVPATVAASRDAQSSPEPLGAAT